MPVLLLQILPPLLLVLVLVLLLLTMFNRTDTDCKRSFLLKYRSTQSQVMSVHERWHTGSTYEVNRSYFLLLFAPVITPPIRKSQAQWLHFLQKMHGCLNCLIFCCESGRQCIRFPMYPFLACTNGNKCYFHIYVTLWHCWLVKLHILHKWLHKWLQCCL